MRPMFVPLKGCYFDAFAAGTKLRAPLEPAGRLPRPAGDAVSGLFRGAAGGGDRSGETRAGEPRPGGGSISVPSGRIFLRHSRGARQ
jgi:hypothetical protein